MTEMSGFSLGVDTGGTFTDAVLVDRLSKRIISSAKSLTTKDALYAGITSAITQCIDDMPKTFSPGMISMVCLSTTLATNAITEGYGGSVCQIMIGYDRQMFEKHRFFEELASDDIIWLPGGHNLQGEEVSPLDGNTARKEILRRLGRVDAFAVSGYFGTRNPDHELQVKSIIENLSKIPITCAHELTNRLNAVSRAVTVGHNARLIPLIKDLLSHIARSLKQLRINAPLMVVKGDGTIVPSVLAVQRPIETILSGPAASCVGASNLTGEKDVWVADMGGTTTDIALLKNSRPAINPEGAYISHRRSMVEAVDIHTVGIGGDSKIGIGRQADILIGPKRVIPLCLLAEHHADVLSHLKRMVKEEQCEDGGEQFLVLRRSPAEYLDLEHRELLTYIGQKPLPLLAFTQDRKKFINLRRIRQLEKKYFLQLSGFTPTDALHVLGKMQVWNKETSVLGATLLAARLEMSATTFCNAVLKTMTDRLVREMIGKALESKTGLPNWDNEITACEMLDLASKNLPDSELACSFKLKKPMVAIGAPVEAYMPMVAQSLNTRLILPEHASVANAFGAATAGIMQRKRAVVRMMEGGLFFRVHLPDGVADLPDLESAKAHAQERMISYVVQQAESAGAVNIRTEIFWQDHTGKLPAGVSQEVFLDVELEVSACGEVHTGNAGIRPSTKKGEIPLKEEKCMHLRVK